MTDTHDHPGLAARSPEEKRVPAPPVSRRQAILGTAGVVSAGLLAAGAAGCSSGQGLRAADAGNGAAGGGGGAAATGPITAVSAVPVGGAISASAGGRPVIVAQPTSGQIVAFSAVCTHAGCTVAPEGKRLVCPCHGSVFDAFTGKRLEGPAPAPLPSVAVTVQGGEVLPA